MLRILTRVAIAPFFLVSVILGFFLVVFVVAAISIGGWCETLMLKLGYRGKPVLLPAFVGTVLFVGLALAGMGVLGNSLIGWPGAVLGPLLAMGAIAVVDHW